ncbi:MAG TPA: HNH endonuclease domain-containing protein [Thermoanaerobaculia bacterium]|nr:HNH endonuclease domain-containing protein [Thermoanaerobaculia bacterium]
MSKLAPAQAKLPERGAPSRPPADHVQRALASTAQARLKPQAVQPRLQAVHVQASVAEARTHRTLPARAPVSAGGLPGPLQPRLAAPQAQPSLKPVRHPHVTSHREQVVQQAEDKKVDDVLWPAGAEEKSPYRDIDYKGYGAVSGNRGYSAAQRTKILAMNRANNGGSLKSDAPDDPNQDLVEARGSKNSAEVDHIIPSSRGGSNSPLNARVISWELNNKIQRVVVAALKLLVAGPASAPPPI